jgi:Protein of unknown function (DUF2778)
LPPKPALQKAALQKSAPQKRPSRWSQTFALTLAALGASLTAAAWMTGSDLTSFASAALPKNTAPTTSFADRFASAPAPAKSDSLVPLRQSVLARVETEFSSAKEALASRWMPTDFRGGLVPDDELHVADTKPAVAVAANVPLPRSRPAAADQVTQLQAVAQTAPVLALNDNPPQAADRSVFQKFSDMMHKKITLASLGPGGGLFGHGPDLTEFGYDGATAVYDITAHVVYLPNGTVFEAHSGMGELRDDPDRVSVPNLGATPPAMYSLKPREKEFHGVAALRMTPAEGSDIGGRAGLLVHSYMLGPKGDSNGCISVRDYDRFLKAYTDGQFSHIAVVPSLKAVAQQLASQDPT